MQPWGQVLTLTDEDIRRPVTAVVILLQICAVAAPTEWILFYRQMTRAQYLPYLLILCCLSLLLGLLMFWGIDKRSVVRLKNLSQVDDVLRQTRRVHSEKFFLWGMGSGTIQCPRGDDEIWRAAISKLAPEVGVVIIDCGDEVSAALLWEVDTLSSACGPEKMVLAIPQRADATVDRLAFDAMESALQRRFAPAALPDVIVYPRRIPRIAITRRYEAIVRPAQRIIGMAAFGVRPERGEYPKAGRYD